MVRRASPRPRERVRKVYSIYLCLCDALCFTLAFIHSKIQWDFVVPIMPVKSI